MKFGKFLRKLKRTVLNAIYPPRCSGCGELLSEGALCENCRKSLVTIPSPVCHKCGASLCDHDTLNCTGISAEVVAAYYYGGTVKELILNLKDDVYDNVFDEFLDGICDKINTEYTSVNFDMTVCVPSYNKGEYSSSAVIAENLAKIYMLDFDRNILTKYRQTQKQHFLSQEERMVNLKNSIKVTPGKENDIKGKTILLCDDVKSTGMTLNECVKALYSAGAENVCCICVAVSDYVRRKSKR